MYWELSIPCITGFLRVSDYKFESQVGNKDKLPQKVNISWLIESSKLSWKPLRSGTD